MAKKKDLPIVVIKNNDLIVGTGRLAQGFGVEHRALKRLIVKYKKEFEELGKVKAPIPKKDITNVGRRLEEYKLNEKQLVFLCTCLLNNKVTIKIKLELAKNKNKNVISLIKKILNEPLPSKKGYVYLLEKENGHVKIGRSVSANKRIRDITSQGCLIIKNKFISSQTETFYELETSLHHKFKDFWISGEWFDISFDDAKNELIHIYKTLIK